MANPTPPDPYQSARDLPSVVELTEQLEVFKAMPEAVPEQQKTLREIEQQLDGLVQTVDRFYERLGERNWIFHDDLNVEAMKVVASLEPPDAEQALIAYYQNPDNLRFLLVRLRRLPAMRSRLSLIDRAREDYEAGRYDSATLKLITVMDGFVNDIETESRRGLHARTEDEMAAWNSIVGHHMGLKNAHQTFTKGFYRTSEGEVYELYRNGIIHGMLPNFNNAIVATKAWNRLFAVTDWAESREKQATPKEADPTLTEVLEQAAENQRVSDAMEGWEARSLKPDDPGFQESDAFKRVTQFLDHWKGKNYGEMARMLSTLVRQESFGQSAGRVRDDFGSSQLEDFQITRLNFEAPVICEIDAQCQIDGESKAARLRWIREQENGQPGVEGAHDGEWRLITPNPSAMLNRASGGDQPGESRPSQ